MTNNDLNLKLNANYLIVKKYFDDKKNVKIIDENC